MSMAGSGCPHPNPGHVAGFTAGGSVSCPRCPDVTPAKYAIAFDRFHSPELDQAFSPTLQYMGNGGRTGQMPAKRQPDTPRGGMFCKFHEKGTDRLKHRGIMIIFSTQPCGKSGFGQFSSRGYFRVNWRELGFGYKE